MTEPIITVLSKNGCVPCETVKATLKSSNIKFEEINLFDNAHIATKFKIRNVPTVMFTNKPLTDDTAIEVSEKFTGPGTLDKIQQYVSK
ncbi:gp244 [Sphingomonas phage PAU]|uniref:gp244 n=1 Tax=Sphingomonas phage PAU TaxID=1150991 RepID=UPI00025733FA|nr:gp244 [Sphingomonas phage PAU]AFF28242.1 gp244 [Sphingomonas phage PAU]